MTTYSKSGIEKLSVYGDMVNAQLWLLAARNRVYNTCNGTDPARMDPQQAKAICQNADRIYETMFKKAKDLTAKLDAAMQAASATKQLADARAMAKKIHRLNRNTMKAVCFLTETAIEHKGKQPKTGPVITPAMDPRAKLDMDEYLGKLSAAAGDLG